MITLEAKLTDFFLDQTFPQNAPCIICPSQKCPTFHELYIFSGVEYRTVHTNNMLAVQAMHISS